jgi:hypothetical protein
MTEQAGPGVTFYTSIQMVLGSNLGQDAGYSEISYSFLQPTHPNMIAAPSGHEHFCPKPFQLIISNYQLTLYNLEIPPTNQNGYYASYNYC